jgi:NhaP-type Na+/H+ or K+/H+ antiporter
VYYLTFAIHKGLPRELAEPLTALMLATIVTSIVLHGVTVTPLMQRYQRTRRT